MLFMFVLLFGVGIVSWCVVLVMIGFCWWYMCGVYCVWGLGVVCLMILWGLEVVGFVGVYVGLCLFGFWVLDWMWWFGGCVFDDSVGFGLLLIFIIVFFGW